METTKIEFCNAVAKICFHFEEDTIYKKQVEIYNSFIPREGFGNDFGVLMTFLELVGLARGAFKTGDVPKYHLLKDEIFELGMKIVEYATNR